jgi:hypothetical protein
MGRRRRVLWRRRLWRGGERKVEGEREGGGKKTDGAGWVFFHLSHWCAALHGRPCGRECRARRFRCRKERAVECHGEGMLWP